MYYESDDTYQLNSYNNINTTGVMEMTDNEIVKLLKSSPDKGRRALFDEYCNYVYAIAAGKLRSCGTREDIEECVSDIFAEIYRSFDEGKITGGIKPILITIAKRRAIDYFRRVSGTFGKTVSIDDEDFKEQQSAERIDDDAEVRDRNRIIMKKIGELGEPDSTIIIQQYFYNRTAKEIAKTVSLTAGNVQKRSSRAREMLRSLLLEAGISY